MDRFKEKLKEGSIYRLEYFMVVSARPKYRTPHHPYKIRITKNTKNTKVAPQPENFHCPLPCT